jgi:hypothetical protein
MTQDANIPEWPHKPAPPERRRILPERELLVRGLALLALAVGLCAAAIGAVRLLSWLLLPLSAVLTIAGALSAWAAAIHLTGGEKFDDHPWV